MAEPEIAGTSPIGQQMDPGTYAWCACGKSKTQPFCDGSHLGTEFSPVMATLQEPQEVWWCCCKRSGNKPYCDGTHKTLT
jgi:CDGSH-type Zn-finger protein